MPQWLKNAWGMSTRTFGTLTMWSLLAFILSWMTFRLVEIHWDQLVPITSENSLII